MKNRILTFLLPLVALLFCGCYKNRLTENYDQIPELDASSNNAFIETTDNIEDEQKRIKILEDLDMEEAPTYTINAGDKIRIMVYNHEDLSASALVTPDGYIGLMFIGQIKVVGKTMQEVAEEIEEKLSDFIRNPKVGIFPYEIHSETVTISGGIVKPGMYSISNGMRLADLYALAGGGSTRLFDGQVVSAVNLSESILVRDNKIVPIDFERAISSGLRPDNILLRKGDYVYIASSDESMVYLIGDVKKPSRQLWSKNLGLLELLSNAGWVNETHWSHVIIIRGGIANPKMYKVDLDGILAGKKSNVYLASGDIIYLPRDDISEYNVFVRKLLPTGQLINLLTMPKTLHNTYD